MEITLKKRTSNESKAYKEGYAAGLKAASAAIRDLIEKFELLEESLCEKPPKS